jgi:sec-independent protein translocase protein TatA
MPNLGVPELLIILVIVAMLFGVGKLPSVFGAVGKGIREFRKESTDADATAATLHDAANATANGAGTAAAPVVTTTAAPVVETSTQPPATAEQLK